MYRKKSSHAEKREFKYKVREKGKTRWRKRADSCLKALSFSFPPFLPPPHPLMGASFWTIQHGAFIVPLKWSTFSSPTYVCSFKITMAAGWIEGMIHLLRHSVTVDQKPKNTKDSQSLKSNSDFFPFHTANIVEKIKIYCDVRSLQAETGLSPLDISLRAAD